MNISSGPTFDLGKLGEESFIRRGMDEPGAWRDPYCKRVETQTLFWARIVITTCSHSENVIHVKMLDMCLACVPAVYWCQNMLTILTHTWDSFPQIRQNINYPLLYISLFYLFIYAITSNSENKDTTNIWFN